MSGITLLELMFTVSIVAVLMAIAVPSYKYVTASNRIASEVNGLLGDMQYARAEAIKEGQWVTVCTSTNGTACAGTNAWNSGWIVFSDPNNNQTVPGGATPLRVQQTFTGTDTFNADNAAVAVTFNREGFAVASPNPASPITITLHDSTSNPKWTRCLAVQFVGMLATQTHGTGNCT